MLARQEYGRFPLPCFCAGSCRCGKGGSSSAPQHSQCKAIIHCPHYCNAQSMQQAFSAFHPYPHLLCQAIRKYVKKFLNHWYTPFLTYSITFHIPLHKVDNMNHCPSMCAVLMFVCEYDLEGVSIQTIKKTPKKGLWKIKRCSHFYGQGHQLFKVACVKANACNSEHSILASAWHLCIDLTSSQEIKWRRVMNIYPPHRLSNFDYLLTLSVTSHAFFSVTDSIQGPLSRLTLFFIHPALLVWIITRVNSVFLMHIQSLLSCSACDVLTPMSLDFVPFLHFPHIYHCLRLPRVASFSR